MTGSIQGSFAERLLSWWDEHGRKDLPWQTSRNPYRVWISEIMLQQTQVTTVIPYFNKWMESFPDLETLAKAPLDEVLAHWSGLGYYARARNLHKAAARHAAIEGWAGKAVVQRQLWQEARDRLPMGKGDDYTQAVMDLGATICTRSNPYCERCPVNQDCRALLQDLTGRLPTPNPPSKVTDLDLHMLILQDDEGRVLLEKRPPAGIWGGLWCLPSDESLEKIESGLGTIGVDPRPLEHFEHRLSHRRIRIYPWLAISPRPTGVKCDDRVSWCDATRQQSLGVPKPVSDLLNRLDNGEFE